MSRDATVNFETVRSACFEILSRGERPSRPAVQELLATDRYVGRKGSNEVVQRLIAEFWQSMGKSLTLPDRTVEGVPSEFVPVLDKALADMTDIARKLAGKELEDRVAALNELEKEQLLRVEDAQAAALSADQLRIRAEGELTALQGHAFELKGNLAEAERKLAHQVQEIEQCRQIITDKDAELRQQFVSLEAARASLDQMAEGHRAELTRLMLVLDKERQDMRAEIKQANEQLRRSQAETASMRDDNKQANEQLRQAQAETAGVRDEMSALHVEIGRLQAEAVAIQRAFATAEEELASNKAKLARTEEKMDAQAATINAMQQEATKRSAAFDALLEKREGLEMRLAGQREEIQRLQAEIQMLQGELKI